MEKQLKTYFCRAYNYQPCARTQNNHAKRVICCNMCSELSCKDRCNNNYEKCKQAYMAFLEPFFVAEDVDGDVLGCFKNVKTLAKNYGISTTTAYFYLQNDLPYNGIYFKVVE